MIICDDCGHYINEPRHETLVAYTERTGKPLLDSDLVWVLFGTNNEKFWSRCDVRTWKKQFSLLSAVTASPGAGKPKNDWRPGDEAG